ncbi:hypothetical protein OHA72_40600 [Dactylosporangium sp. NBC_01737]|nr:hypothetical protein OHA72_40600 [Dactylosporangium sp. NBC_01737]
MRLDDPLLDSLLRCGADDMTADVLLTDAACTWICHPYDCGADTFTGSATARDRHCDWLPPR